MILESSTISQRKLFPYGFSCCICQAPNQTLAQLRVHVLSHPEYNFAFDFKPSRGGCQIVISHRDDGFGSPIRPQVYQLGRPLRALDLEKLIDGDDSWITSRYGPDNDVSPQFTAVKVAQVSTLLVYRSCSSDYINQATETCWPP